MDSSTHFPGAIGPIAKRTVKDQISDKLAAMVHAGVLRQGDELPSERALAATLGVARETVRAAISALQACGMVEVSQGARTRVLGNGTRPPQEPASTLNNVRGRPFEEVAEARAAVELQIMRLAAARMGPQDRDRLAALVHEQDGMSGDPVAFQISDREFHLALYRACGNSLLADVASDFYRYAIDLQRSALLRPGAIARSVADHRRIVEALHTREPEAVASAMQQHLDQVRHTWLAEMDR